MLAEFVKLFPIFRSPTINKLPAPECERSLNIFPATTHILAGNVVVTSIWALPVGVGFGIKDAASAAAISAVSDGVIVGSAIVKIIENNADDTDTIMNDIGSLLSSMREAMDA